MNPTEKWESSQDLSAAAFHAVRELLPDKDANAIRGYIYEANEWGLGVEKIIDALVECNVEISQLQKRAIDVAADSMGIDRDQSKVLVAEP